jgi:hypothetical protein
MDCGSFFRASRQNQKKSIDEQNQQEKKRHQEHHPDFDAFGYVVGDSCGRCLYFLSANHRPEHLDNNV